MSDRRDRGVNILILEGGGARGLSSLVILDELMTRLQHKMQLEFQPKVRDHFGILAGTGTGAVIACMVGRLGMSIQRAIECYVKLAEVFSERKRMGTTIYKTTKLQGVLKGMVQDATGNQDAGMMDNSTDADKCRTMVFAMSAHNMNAGRPCIFRSYKGIAQQMPDAPIWQVLSATMAHPDMFKPIDIGPDHLRQSFIDGGLGCNNPAAHVLAEVKALLPSRDVSSVVCIGTGHPSTIQLSERSSFVRFMPTNVLALTKTIALDAERVAEDMEARFRSTTGVYYRFSVDQGLQSVETREWEKLSQITAHAQAYMRSVKVGTRASEAVIAIAAQNNVIGIKRIDGEIQAPINSGSRDCTVCPDPTPVFTGRQELIDEIVTCISHGNTRRCVFVLHGLGGTGKTQLALETVRQTKDIWTDIIFVDATTHETAIAALIGFAKEKVIGESHESTLRWLSKQGGKWLMIVDNADDPKMDIRKYFPTGDTGSILVTTRISQHALLALGQNSDHCVSSMRLEESLILLLKVARMQDDKVSGAEREAAIQLLEHVGYLALAIVQAGAYIFVSKQSIARYLDMLVRHREETLEKYNQLPARMDSYQKSVYTTWHMSYTLLSKRTQRLLHLMAFMHHSGITEDTFRRAAVGLRSYKPEIPATDSEAKIQEHLTECLQPYLCSRGSWNSCAFVGSMTELLSYSLISFDKINNEYNLHVLVHDWAGSVIQHPAYVAVKHTALLLALSIDCADTMESLVYKRMIELHVNRILENHMLPTPNTAVRFSQVYDCTGKFAPRLMLDQIALSGRQLALGERHNLTLISMKDVAYDYQQLGRYSEAAALLKQVVEIRKQVSGHDHRETLIATRTLADTYHYLHRYTSALSLRLQILSTCQRIHPYKHPEILLSMHDIAVTYQAQSRYNQAEALLVEVVDAMKQVKGDEHPETLASMHALAYTYYCQGQYDAAESMQVHVLEVRKRRQGDEHPSTLSAMNDLALTYCDQSRYGDAEEMQVKVLETRRRAYGEEHPETLTNMNNLACTYRDQGRYLEAEELGKQVLEGAKRIFVTEHPRIRLSMRNLLETYKAMGENRHQEYATLLAQIRELEATNS